MSKRRASNPDPSRRTLWAPWRGRFIRQGAAATRRCIFCRHPRARHGRRRWILHRRRLAFSLLNLYPYNNGHLMVAPYRHVAALSALTREELVDCWELAAHCERLLQRVLHPHGYNIGINLGRTGGAGFASHLHIHIVPRWHGDTNFLPVVGGAKVISESLAELYRRLRDADTH